LNPHPLKLPVVEDWDALEALWESAYSDKLRLDPTEHPLLMVEPAWNTRSVREKLIEIAFEKYKVPAFYLARAPVCAA
jgi:actin-like protein 6A